MPSILCLSVVLTFWLTHDSYAETKTVTHGEQKIWIQNVIPLPHEITIARSVELHPGKIGITVTDGADDATRKAAEELRGLFREKTGSEPAGSSFRIVLGIPDDRGALNGITVKNAGRLASLPNKDQAYVIEPSGDDTLLLAALDGAGVYYAAMTLLQLIEPHLTAEKAVIPLAEVVDWPDMEERGLWNFPDPETWIPWMSSIKLNYGKMVATKLHTIERDKPNHATIDADLMVRARSRGFNYLPFILHLNFLHAHGMYRAYPELAGIGDTALAGRYFAHKTGNRHRAPCANNPILTQILAEWMDDIASQGADEVSCWLTERPAQCGHEECREAGQFVLEARAFVNAWRETVRKHPGFTIRLFISTTTDERYYKVLAETPKEVKLERCCSADLERVRHLPRDLFVNPLFDHYAADGYWVANYDVPIGAYGRVETPEFKVPSSSAHRIRDFVDQLAERNYSGAYGMLAWGTLGMEICGFNINALAEWSWNKNGRTTREFAEAWARRHGYADPAAVGEWSEIMGEVEFDVYESDFPTCWSWGKAVGMIDERRQPLPGEGMFRYYPTVESFGEKITRCDRALSIAESFGEPHLANETKVVLSYIRLAEAVYSVAALVSDGDFTAHDNQDRLKGLIADLERAEKENTDAIRAWRTALGPEPWHYRVHDAISATESTVSSIKDIITGKYLF